MIPRLLAKGSSGCVSHRLNPDSGLQLLFVRVDVLVQLTDSVWRVLVNACFPLGSRE